MENVEYEILVFNNLKELDKELKTNSIRGQIDFIFNYENKICILVKNSYY